MTLSIFVAALFENLEDEGICGRFGRERRLNVSHIGQVGFRPDDLGESFT
ncbi:MAG: hypothetical protein RLZZ437_1437, partial [Pseudomonadota bacterium]